MQDLERWGTFYVILGSAAGALIGLQFVVMALIADNPTTERGVKAFTTPTVVHFATTLVLSALACAPWPRLNQLAIALGVIGIAGVIYGLVVGRHMLGQDVHHLSLSDWTLHLLLPSAAYLLLICASLIVHEHGIMALWTTALTALLLLLLGVRSSWGVISYHAIS